MAFGRLVAARFLDGTVRKGVTVDYKTGCAWFHIREDEGELARIDTNELKAVFFIRNVDGNAKHKEEKDYTQRTSPEKKVWIEFNDGECLAGWSSTLGRKDGFYFTPTDADSNMERAFVYRHAIARLRHADDAVRAAAEHDAACGGIEHRSHWPS